MKTDGSDILLKLKENFERKFTKNRKFSLILPH